MAAGLVWSLGTASGSWIKIDFTWPDGDKEEV